MNYASIPKRILAGICTFALLLILTPPVGASLVSSSQYWTELDRGTSYTLARSSEDYVVVFYSNRCGYSKKWVPQMYAYANYNKIPIYGVDSMECGNSFGASGTYPIVIVKKDGERTVHSAVHSLETFQSIVGGVLDDTKGDFQIRAGMLSGYTGTDTELVIPENLGIIGIGEKCFANNQTLHSVVIPEGVTIIEDYAFYYCSALASVYLPSTLESIGNLNFSGCQNMQTVYFSGPRPTFGSYYPFGTQDGIDAYGEEMNSGRFAAVVPEGDASWSDLTDLKAAYPHVNWGAKPGQIRNIPAYSTLEGKADAWAIPYVAEAISYGLQPDSIRGYKSYTNAISRDHFCRIVMNLIYKQIGEYSSTVQSLPTQSPFTDTAHYEIRRAYYLGLVSGRENGTFDPNGKITRQEAAVMLQAAGKYLGLKATTTAKVYPDENSIAPWAAEAVDYVTALGIMSGTDKGFEPLGTYSYQQAYCTFLKLYKLTAAS